MQVLYYFLICEMTDEEMKGSIRKKLASTRKGNISAISRKWLKIAYERGPWFPLVAFLDPLLLTRTCKFRCCFTTKVTPLAPSSCIWYLSWPSNSQKNHQQLCIFYLSCIAAWLPEILSLAALREEGDEFTAFVQCRVLFPGLWPVIGHLNIKTRVVQMKECWVFFMADHIVQ